MHHLYKDSLENEGGRGRQRERGTEGGRRREGDGGRETEGGRERRRERETEGGTRSHLLQLMLTLAGELSSLALLSLVGLSGSARV